MFNKLINKISENIIGNNFNIKISLATILSGGHILIEDLPGTGKTTFAKTITNSLNLEFKRIQFTSDLLPSDILGYTYLKNNNFETNKGPIFTNIVLADELNRASPKTQSAFLEAMEEKTVTIDKETFSLPDPFTVIATQNPSDLSGTSLLPESQLDRFMISFSLDELDKEQRIKLLNQSNIFSNTIQSDFNFKDVRKINDITVKDNVIHYLDNIAEYIKFNFPNIHISPRSLKQTLNLAKGMCIIESKDFVTYQEIKDVIPYVLRHRISVVEKNQTLNFVRKDILTNVKLPNEV